MLKQSPFRASTRPNLEQPRQLSMIVLGFSSMMDTNWQEGLLSKAFNRGSIDDQFERLPCIAQPRCHSQLRSILLHRLPGSVDVLPLRRVSAVRGVAQVPRLAAVDNHDQKFDFQSGTDTLFTHYLLIGLASPQAVQIAFFKSFHDTSIYAPHLRTWLRHYAT